MITGAGMIGSTAFSGLAGAKPGGRPGPCHKTFSCGEDGMYVKFEFVVEKDPETGDILECYFEEETDTGLLTIDEFTTKEGQSCEPIDVSWTVAAPYGVETVMAFGGMDCDNVVDPDGYYESALVNNGGNRAAISNLQFCLVEQGLPECPFYGTSRADPTAIWSIRTDPETGAVLEEKVLDITADLTDSNYPNGLAFDPESEVWYFAEKGGILNTVNEDGCLGVKTYSGVSGGKDIAGAAYYDGGYYFTPQGGDALYRVDISSGSAVRTTVCANLPLGAKNFGDIAISPDGIAYFSVNGAFFKVDLADCDTSEVIVQSSDREKYAVLSQIAFANDTLWAHHAGTGDWRTVDVETGELSDLIDTTREYTDIAQCGPYELHC